MPLIAPTLGAVTVADTSLTPSGCSPAAVTGLGIGSTVHSASSIKSLDAAAVQTGPIGHAQTEQTLHAVSTDTVDVGANKGVRYMAVGASDVANGAVIATGWVNRSGATMKAGENAIGVAA